MGVGGPIVGSVHASREARQRARVCGVSSDAEAWTGVGKLRVGSVRPEAAGWCARRRLVVPEGGWLCRPAAAGCVRRPEAAGWCAARRRRVAPEGGWLCIARGRLVVCVARRRLVVCVARRRRVVCQPEAAHRARRRLVVCRPESARCAQGRLVVVPGGGWL